MEYFIFKLGRDEHLIQSFLESASLAHNEEIKSTDWFLWKFGNNSFGQSILACAKDAGKIVASVALGIQDFSNNVDVIKGALSFETFVHPDYQGKGIFRELINLAEVEARCRDVSFILNFPNKDSLRGFLKSGWNQLFIMEYWIKPLNRMKVLVRLNDLAKPFLPNKSTELLQKKSMSFNLKKTSSFFSSVINNSYLDWRFASFPVSDYITVDTKGVFCIARVGFRGKLKEVQVLYMTSFQGDIRAVKNLLHKFSKITNCDLISFPISMNNTLRGKLKRGLFFKVPNGTNVTYKVLDKTPNSIIENLELSAINFHTY